MTTMPGLEGPTVAAYIYQRLTQDPALQALLPGITTRVVEGTAPESTPHPFVRFRVLDGTDVKVVGQHQVMATVPVQVIVTTDGSSYDPAIPVYRRVHELLESQQDAQVNGAGRVMSCHRVSGIQFPERTNGVEYRHIGGLYTTNTQ